ncbi:MAG TPA: histidine phosphatase family protein [Flavobacterium sp.]|jgi:phosphohistidine phosphatase
MKNLILIRHGKSSWETASGDFGRPLASRGIADIELVAKASISHLPSDFQIFSSPARRAKQTAILYATAISYSPDNITFLEDLYTFNASTLELVIKDFDDRFANVILFGHNEAITNFVNKFGNIYIDNVPTSGFVPLTFDILKWRALTKGSTGTVIFPTDLKQ